MQVRGRRYTRHVQSMCDSVLALPSEGSHTTTTTEPPVGVHLREFRARLGLSTVEVARRADLPTSPLVDAGLGIIELTMIELCAVLRILTVRRPSGQRAVMNASRHDIEACLGGQWDQDAAAEPVERTQAASSDIEAGGCGPPPTLTARRTAKT